jgi:protein-tyrosine phosphatase
MQVTFKDTSATQYDSNAFVVELAANPKNYGKLYLGDRYSGSFLQLKHRNCYHVINCDKEIHSLSREEDVTYLNIDPVEENSEALEDSFRFLETHLSNGKTITVLCQSGVNKSAAVLVYYIMRRERLTPFEATDYLKTFKQKVRLSAAIQTFLCREAKKLGLLKTSDKKPPSVRGFFGYYFLAFLVIFFALVYFSLNALIQLKTPAPTSAVHRKPRQRKHR